MPATVERARTRPRARTARRARARRRAAARGIVRATRHARQKRPAMPAYLDGETAGIDSASPRGRAPPRRRPAHVARSSVSLASSASRHGTRRRRAGRRRSRPLRPACSQTTTVICAACSPAAEGDRASASHTHTHTHGMLPQPPLRAAVSCVVALQRLESLRRAGGVLARRATRAGSTLKSRTCRAVVSSSALARARCCARRGRSPSRSAWLAATEQHVVEPALHLARRGVQLKREREGAAALSSAAAEQRARARVRARHAPRTRAARAVRLVQEEREA